MIPRIDETWHRLREWTQGSAVSERLAAQILLDQDYKDFDPSHPLGGPDGGKDALCSKNGKRWIMAVYFPRGQLQFSIIKKKFLNDLAGVAKNAVDGLVFVTNQELTLTERDLLKELAGSIELELFHLERIVDVLDQPRMDSIRKKFLFLESNIHSLESILSSQSKKNQKKTWVWHCTDESIAAKQISVCAVFEIFLAVGIYWGLSLYFDWPWTTFVSMIAAPILLLRSNESIEFGVNLFYAHWERQKNVFNSHNQFVSWFLFIAFLIGLIILISKNGLSGLIATTIVIVFLFSIPLLFMKCFKIDWSNNFFWAHFISFFISIIVLSLLSYGIWAFFKHWILLKEENKDLNEYLILIILPAILIAVGYFSMKRKMQFIVALFLSIVGMLYFHESFGYDVQTSIIQFIVFFIIVFLVAKSNVRPEKIELIYEFFGPIAFLFGIIGACAAGIEFRLSNIGYLVLFAVIIQTAIICFIFAVEFLKRSLFAFVVRPLFISGIFARALLIRFYATLWYPLVGWKNLADNWQETLLLSDFFRLPELMPKAGEIHPKLKVDFLWRKIISNPNSEKITPIMMLIVWYIPSIAYRLSLKASFWLWFPLALAFKPALTNCDLEDARISIGETTAFDKARLMLVGIIALWLLSTSPIFFAIYKLMPHGWREIMEFFPTPPRFGTIRYVLGWTVCFLTITLIILSIKIKAAHSEALQSLSNIHPRGLLKFLFIAKNLERVRLMLIAVIFLWGESLALGFALSLHSNSIRPFVLPWILENL